MPRKLRLEFSGACYHVTNRGNYRRALFARSEAAEAFYRCLDQACLSFGWRVHAFVIMGNHFHLVVETPEPNLSLGMKWLQGTWAQRFNRFRGLVGRPFQGRYGAKHIEPGHMLAQVAHYTHLNPVRAKLVSAEEVGKYRWSSLALFPRQDRPAWLEPRTLPGESGGLADSPAGWRSYCDYLALLVEADPRMRDEKFAELARGWAAGSTAFRAELRAKLTGAEKRGRRFALLGADRAAVKLARAELWEAELRRLTRAFRIKLARLPAPKSAADKVTLAAAMKQTTSASNAWLAQRLQMGTANSIGPLLHRFRASGAPSRPAFKSVLYRILT